MKVLIILLSLIPFSLFAQTSEETRLKAENEQLKEKIKLLEAQQKNGNPNDAQSQRLMETLKKGQKFQEEQNKALQELEDEGL